MFPESNKKNVGNHDSGVSNDNHFTYLVFAARKHKSLRALTTARKACTLNFSTWRPAEHSTPAIGVPSHWSFKDPSYLQCASSTVRSVLPWSFRSSSESKGRNVTEIMDVQWGKPGNKICNPLMTKRFKLICGQVAGVSRRIPGTWIDGVPEHKEWLRCFYARVATHNRIKHWLNNQPRNWIKTDGRWCVCDGMRWDAMRLMGCDEMRWDIMRHGVIQWHEINQTKTLWRMMRNDCMRWHELRKYEMKWDEKWWDTMGTDMMWEETRRNPTDGSRFGQDHRKRNDEMKSHEW